MYSIGVFSKINRITVKTLRHYDRIGLLKPHHVDEFTGYRYYSSGQLPRLHKIMNLKQMGFSLEEIMLILTDLNSSKDFKALLNQKKQQVEIEMKSMESKLMQITSYLENLKGESEIMNYNVVVKELPEVIVASMRRVIPNYDAYYEFYPEMGKQMEEKDCVCANPPYCFTLYHDKEYKEENIDVEICEAVTEFKEDTEQLKFKKVEKVPEAACILHKGPYSTLAKTYAKLFKWIEDNGYKVTGLPRESYIDGIWNKENEEEWLTEIQVPIKK